MQKELYWRRFHIKSRQVLTDHTTFDLELEKIESLHHKNEKALADLVSFREDLLRIYVKSELNSQNEGLNRNFPQIKKSLLNNLRLHDQKVF